jgi:hypothetical protein
MSFCKSHKINLFFFYPVISPSYLLVATSGAYAGRGASKIKKNIIL